MLINIYSQHWKGRPLSLLYHNNKLKQIHPIMIKIKEKNGVFLV